MPLRSALGARAVLAAARWPPPCSPPASRAARSAGSARRRLAARWWSRRSTSARASCWPPSTGWLLSRPASRSGWSSASAHAKSLSLRSSRGWWIWSPNTWAPRWPAWTRMRQQETRLRHGVRWPGRWPAWHVRVLAPAAAEDQNGVAVTRATARRLHLSTVSDLRRAASPLILAAPAGCPDRPFCLPGLRTVYGLRFARFLPLDTEPAAGHRAAAGHCQCRAVVHQRWLPGHW